VKLLVKTVKELIEHLLWVPKYAPKDRLWHTWLVRRLV